MDIAAAKIIVTGGASGLGKAVVDEFLRHDALVAIIDSQADSDTQPEDHLLSYCVDVTDESAVANTIDDISSQFGAINCLVNCAGIVCAERVVGRERLHTIEKFTKVVDVNLTGTFLMCRAAANVMQNNTPDVNSERGVIINTSSIAAFDGQIGQAAYAASKGAVVSLTLPLAREFARMGIRVMSVAPGLFETPVLDEIPDDIVQGLRELTVFPRRFGKPQEFAQLVRHIYQNPMLNGEVIRLDGAMRMPAN